MRFTQSLSASILALSLVFAPVSQVAAEEPSQQNLDTLTQVFTVLLENHYTHPDQEKLLRGAIDGMLEVLHDPYTSYMTAEEYNRFVDGLNQSYAGIGVQMEPGEGSTSMQITQVFPNSPARQAGLQAGDKITAVDGVALSKDNINNAQSMIMGKSGTTVQVTIMRDGAATKTYTVTRQQIELPTVISRTLEEEIGYIQIVTFGERTGEDFLKALKELEKSTPKGIIIDLRDNGGGYVVGALEIADALLGESTILVLHDEKGQAIFIPSDADQSQIPLAVLVNEHSASASEMLAGALQKNDRAKLIGVQTFGKGTMQSPYDLPNGGVLKVSIDRYEFSDGTSPDKVGLTPDIKINSPELMTNAALQQLMPSRLQTLSFPRTTGEITLNGHPVLNGQQAVMENGRAYLPLRFMVEAFGSQVNWLAEKAAIQFVLDERSVEIDMKNGGLTVAGQAIPLHAPFRSIDGTTYVSTSAVEKITGQKVIVSAEEIQVQSK